LARTYKRKSNGQFGSGNAATNKSKGDRATTVKQDPNKHRVDRDKLKKRLNATATGGTKRKKALKTRAKVKGRVVRTRAAKNSASRSRKRFG
jgi:hypothetical protein